MNQYLSTIKTFLRPCAHSQRPMKPRKQLTQPNDHHTIACNHLGKSNSEPDKHAGLGKTYLPSNALLPAINSPL